MQVSLAPGSEESGQLIYAPEAKNLNLFTKAVSQPPPQLLPSDTDTQTGPRPLGPSHTAHSDTN